MTAAAADPSHTTARAWFDRPSVELARDLLGARLVRTSAEGAGTGAQANIVAGGGGVSSSSTATSCRYRPSTPCVFPRPSGKSALLDCSSTCGVLSAPPATTTARQATRPLVPELRSR